MADTLSYWHSKWSDGSKSYYDIYWIIHYYLNVGWQDLHSKSLEDFSEPKVLELRQAVDEYKSGKPLAYIIKNIDFYHLSLDICEGVLIPRRDTECMVKEVLARLQGNEKILELGTGSGAIACAIASHKPNCQLVAIDKSEVACKVAKQNVDKYGLNVDVRKADWCHFLEKGFEWVIANPPYIEENDPNLEESVIQYEPSSALISGDRGYADLIYIIKNAKRWLVPGGCLVLEHGFLQQGKLVDLLEAESYTNIYLGNDGQHPRFIVAIC